MEFQEVEQLELIFTSNFKESIKLNLQDFTEDENKIFETNLNKLTNACGCEFGGYFLIIGIFASIIHQYYNSLSLYRYAFYIFGVIVFTIIGKLIGISVSKIKLKYLINEIKKIAQQRMCENAS